MVGEVDLMRAMGIRRGGDVSMRVRESDGKRNPGCVSSPSEPGELIVYSE